MKPSCGDMMAVCPAVDERLVQGHRERLDDDYYGVFSLPVVGRHLDALSGLSGARPVRLLTDRADGRVECTVLAFDYPGEFSLIAGILAGTGFDILSGHVFTYKAASAGTAPAGRRRVSPRTDPLALLLRRRLIIDHFSGTLDSQLSYEDWRLRLDRELAQAVWLLESGKAADLAAARHRVNELVAVRLTELREDRRPVLYPVDIDIANTDETCTTLRVRSQDTPAFLYALSNALALQGIAVERVRIDTVDGRVQDELDVLNAAGQPIRDPALLDRIRLTVLLTKQFTYFLTRAADPYAALSRFERMLQDVLPLPERRRWLSLFSDPDALRGLARILGASDFIWEDFIRTQYEELLPLIRPAEGAARVSFARAEMEQRARAALADAREYAAIKSRLNEWKDREIFLIDLDHLLNAGADVRALAEPLTDLAEIVVRIAAQAVYDALAERYGVPLTVGGLPVRHAIFGLGKMGGVALGYASDIELLFVYSDSGQTRGPGTTSNAEFFDRLAEETALFIQARREGIFRVDLRLRPYGNSGPKACSLESFCRYFGVGGEALSYERLALTRLRTVGGDPALGAQVERLRDQFVYESHAIRRDELRRLRERQFEEKARGNRYNAKFSPGALVDVEYYVQILQVMHGKTFPALRTPRLHQALAALSDCGILDRSESDQLTQAYDFLRRLINGLRMLRGHAMDLFLPEPASDEYVHLARRMGYERTRGLNPETELFVEFETRTALVRAFIERHFGRENVPDPARGNVVDLLLSRDAPAEMRKRVLAGAGFTNANRAFVNLRNLAGDGARREAFVQLAVLAVDILRTRPDPDMALNNWDRFVDVLADPAAHYRALISQPRRMEILLGIFAGSQFLADALVRNPEFLDWVTTPDVLHGQMDRDRLFRELAVFTGGDADHAAQMNALRRFRRREILRIGTKDMCLRQPIDGIMDDLSALAEAVCSMAVAWEWERMEARLTGAEGMVPAEGFCVMGLGKLGGRELNYSSDIDLLGAYDDTLIRLPGPKTVGSLARVMEGLRASLSDHTEEGYAYRVDFRLRPHGNAGALVQTFKSISDYYENHAMLWEIQALLKMRPVAGCLATGHRLIERLMPILARRRDRQEVVATVKTMRAKAVKLQAGKVATDVKTGLGGIRDVEFLVQGLQLLHLADDPALFTGNTVEALHKLEMAGVLPGSAVSRLQDDYLFMRRVEHFLQIMEDRQIHELPRDSAQIAALARRALGEQSSEAAFMEQLHEVQRRIREMYVQYLA